jgi:membrane-bound ClpP family serine protease
MIKQIKDTIKRMCRIGVLVAVFSFGFYVIFPLIPMTYTVNIDAPLNKFTYGMTAQAVRILDLADDNDTVIIKVRSPGGTAVHGLEIVNAIKKTRAHTIGYIDTYAYSAGAMIVVACDELQVSPLSEILFHRPAIGAHLGIRIVVPNDQPVAMMIHKYYLETIKPLLTEEEAKIYEDGGDVTILGDEFKKRLKR